VDIEAVRVLRTLKCGSTVYQGGKVYPQPLPPDILKEIARGSPHIEIIEKKEPEITVQEDEIPKEREEIPEKPRKIIRRSV
jgi:hypothetical protein